MNRDPLERAWPAAEPPPGFADRVLDRLQQGASEPAPRARSPRGLPARPLRWLALPALLLVLGGLFLLWPARSDREGDVIAAEPRRVSIGERVVAQMSSGAHLRWSGDEAWQDSGEVSYEVEPGSPFRVRTPHGSVVVLGTVFRVVVAERGAAEGEAMQKHWAIAGGGAATLGALLWVSVERGSVRLEQGSAALVVGAGQAGAIGADGVPHLEGSAPGARAGPDVPRRKSSREVADAVRRHAARRRAAAAEQRASVPATPSSPAAPEQGPAGGAAGASPMKTQLSPQSEQRREYMQRVMREQYYPAARDCYQELLERQPKAEGRVTLEFAIVGAGDAGVVDRVAQRQGEGEMNDPEFTLCMRESLYTAVFEPPPPEAQETTVVYPIYLKPGSE